LLTEILEWYFSCSCLHLFDLCFASCLFGILCKNLWFRELISVFDVSTTSYFIYGSEVSPTSLPCVKNFYIDKLFTLSHRALLLYKARYAASVLL